MTASLLPMGVGETYVAEAAMTGALLPQKGRAARRFAPKGPIRHTATGVPPLRRHRLSQPARCRPISRVGEYGLSKPLRARRKPNGFS